MIDSVEISTKKSYATSAISAGRWILASPTKFGRGRLNHSETCLSIADIIHFQVKPTEILTSSYSNEIELELLPKMFACAMHSSSTLNSIWNLFKFIIRYLRYLGAVKKSLVCRLKCQALAECSVVTLKLAKKVVRKS